MAGQFENNVSIFPARVSYVLLDDSDKEKFDKYGGWKSIGAIEFYQFINNQTENREVFSALPLNANITKFPLLNEVVAVVRLIRYSAQSSIPNYDPQYYYMSVLNTWNSPEHNVTPDSNDPVSQISGLFKELGFSRLSKNPGDFTIEGRTKNSIKLGSSIEGFNNVFKGANRSPFLVVSNNRETSNTTNNSTFEDINKDGSSLYFLKGHDVSLLLSTDNFKSYKKDYTPAEKRNIVEPKIEPVKIEPVKKEETKKEEKVIVEKEAPKPPKPVSGNTPNTPANLESKKIYGFGNVSNSVPVYARPILDMLSYSEGTAGFSKEYNVVVTFKIIDEWQEAYEKGHPKISVYVGRDSTGKDLYSNAAGRYQFLYSTWVGINKGNLAFSKINQDNSAYNLISDKVDDSILKKAYDKAKQNESYSNNVEFKNILDSLHKTWASIPNSVGRYGYAGQIGNKTPEYYYNVYLYAVSKY